MKWTIGVDAITKLINKIYDTGQIPGDLTKSIFIALPKKSGGYFHAAPPTFHIDILPARFNYASFVALIELCRN